MSQKRKLGGAELEISPLIFGGNVFGWTVDEPAAFGLLDTFVGAGYNCIDTANIYSTWVAGNKGGESEAIIGRWMKKRGCRSKMVISSKVGMEMSPDNKGLSAKHIMQAVEESLGRLQTDYIDLYFSHKDDPSTPIEETLEAYTQLVSQGKVRVIGASNFTAERLEQSLLISEQCGYSSYQVVQPRYNLYDRLEYETTLAPICSKHNLAVIPYSALANGFLTGKYRSEKDLELSTRGKWMKKCFDSRGLRILSALDEVAKEHHTNLAGIALAWLLTRPNIVAPIASATNVQQLHDLLEVSHLKLDAAEVALLNHASE